MASIEELNKAIEVIRNHCEGMEGIDCDDVYCPFHVNCAIKGNIEPPSYWYDVGEKPDYWDEIEHY